MKRRAHTGLLLAAALGPSGAMARSSSQTGDAGAAGQQDAGAALQITDCSFARLTAIALALTDFGINGANLALATSTAAAGLRSVEGDISNAMTA